MKIGISTGTRFYRIGEQYYTATLFDADLWEECLEVFDEVIIADRVVYWNKIEAGFKPTVTKQIRFFEYPNFEGSWSLLKKLFVMLWRAKKVARQVDVWHFHCVHFETFCTWLWARFYGIPYSLELRGDLDWTLAYLKLRGVKFPRFIRAVMWHMTALQLTNPLAVVGVSKYLIKNYPPRNNCCTFAISNCRVPKRMYRQERSWKNDGACRTIICVGRCEASRNPAGVMRALAKLNKRGFTNWKFVWIGSGDLEAKTNQLADKLGISDRVSLWGFVPWEEVFKHLNTADLFLLDSVSEGMPRAMIEAMACALPVISTNVGGVPELLSKDDIVEPLRDDLLADKLYEVLTNPDRLTQMSRRNLKISKDFSKEVLRTRKTAFYAKIKKLVVDSRKKDCSVQ